MKKMVLILLLSAASLFSQTNKINVAISDLIGQGIDATSTSIISDRLRTELVKSGQISVLERNAMQEILKEQGFQQTGCTSDACAIQIGQLLGVSKIVVGSVGKLGKLFTLDIRLIDVATGKIQYSESVDCKCQIEEVLTESVPKIAKKIMENLSPQQAGAHATTMSGTSVSQNFGSLLLETTPAGAHVFLNEKLSGKTPLKSDKLPAGTYNLKLELEAFPALYDTFDITAGDLVQKHYNLTSGKREQDVKKSMANAAQGKKKKNFTLPITFGLVTVVGTAAITAGEMLLHGDIKENSRLKTEYDNLPDPTSQQQYEAYQGKITHNSSKAKTDQLIRNIGYGIAGVGLAGVVVTILF